MLSAQTEVKTPAEAFDLYFKTFVNKSDTSLKALNDYMRPTVKGQDMYQVDFSGNTKEMVDSMSDNFLTIFSPAAAKANKQEAMDYFNAMFNGFNSATYKINNVKLANNEYVKGQKIATIFYRVFFKMPTNPTEEILSTYKEKDPKKLTSEEVKKILITLKESYTKASNEDGVDQEIELYQLVEKGKIYYFSGNIAEGIVTKLTDFYFGSDEEEMEEE